jgi:predicted O-methyltransferase YrrM
VAILSEHVEAYLRELRPPRGPVMAEMEALAEREGVPIVEWETGRMLAALAGALDGRVLEVGTAIGYSALHMAEALDRGSIVTLERDPARIAQARDFLARAGVAGRVEIVEGNANETIPALDGPFDMLFLDATKGEYRSYLELAEPKLSERALLVVDNLLMSGDVAGPDGEGSGRWPRETVEAGRAFNAMLASSEHWRGAVLGVGDGVGLASRVG